MMKEFGYRIFAFFYMIFKLLPVKKGLVFCIATHDDSDEGNIGLMKSYMKERDSKWVFAYLTARDGIKRPFTFFIIKPYQMARASMILLDNIFMPMAYMRMREGINVVQLWHGSAAIKKFGLDSVEGKVYDIAKRACKRHTHLIAGSDIAAGQYESAFCTERDRIYITGLPRTDVLFDSHKVAQKKDRFLSSYPELKGKVCILYAPTFRDDEITSPRLGIDIEKFVKTFPDNVILMIRLHPHVAKNIDLKSLMMGLSDTEKDRVIDVSGYRGVTSVLSVADRLITDYSSIIFEYGVLERPMYFYAYDFERFRDKGRDFYLDYEHDMPGPVVYDEDALYEAIGVTDHESNQRERFGDRFYAYADAGAKKRIYELICE